VRHLNQIENELRAARDIQLSMVPLNFHASTPQLPADIYATLEPAREIGGDLHDFFWGEDGGLYFVVADMSDKGDATFDYETGSHQLARGDAVFVYSDGVTEAMDPGNEFFTEKRLSDVLRALADAPPRAIVSEVIASVRDFAGTAAQADDIAAIAIRLDYRSRVSMRPPVVGCGA
jgi:serine phosphatase RsbU (regulator of sigma subunit)